VFFLKVTPKIFNDESLGLLTISLGTVIKPELRPFQQILKNSFITLKSFYAKGQKEEAVSDTQHNTYEILKYCNTTYVYVTDGRSSSTVGRTTTPLLWFQYTHYKFNCWRDIHGNEQ
jgi:hypothetical protein